MVRTIHTDESRAKKAFARSRARTSSHFTKRISNRAARSSTSPGDVNPDDVKRVVEKALAAWAPGGERPPSHIRLPSAVATTIYLVDKPKAAQSVFSIGLVGPPRDTPDYFPLQVMNTILGGIFQSRLQHNIREEKGYSYGVNSRFAYGKGPGRVPWRRIDDDREDRQRAHRVHEGATRRPGRTSVHRRRARARKGGARAKFAEQFATVGATSNAITNIYLQGLPQDYYQTFATKVNAVTKDDLVRVAKKYIDLGHLNIIIVGDRAVIEDPLRKTGIAPIVILDPDAKPVVRVTP